MAAGVVAMTACSASTASAPSLTCHVAEGIAPSVGAAFCSAVEAAMADRQQPTSPALAITAELLARSNTSMSARLLWRDPTLTETPVEGPVVDVQSIDAPLNETAFRQLADGLFLVTPAPPL